MKALCFAVLELLLITALAYFCTWLVVLWRPEVTLMPDDAFFQRGLIVILALHCLSVMVKTIYLKHVPVREIAVIVGVPLGLILAWQLTRGAIFFAIVAGSWYLWMQILDPKVRAARS